MNLTILTPDELVFEGAIKSVKVPGINGQFEILSNHAPVVSALTNGDIRVIDAAGKSTTFPIVSGFVEVLSGSVSVLAQGVTKN